MHFSGYGYSWRILSWFGIDLNEASGKLLSKSLIRTLFKFPFILWIALGVYNMLLVVAAIPITDIDLRAFIPSLGTCFLSNILWFFMFKRRASIRDSLIKAANFSTEHQLETFFRCRTFNLVLASYFAIQITYGLVAVYLLRVFADQYPYYPDLWALQYHMEYGIVWNIVMFCCNMAFILQTATFSGFVSLLMSGIFLQLSRSLRSYKKKLKTFTDSDESLVEFVGEYSKLIGIVREFSDVLSTPLFVVFIMNLLLMFNGLAMFLMLKKEELLEPFVWENVFLLISATWSLLSMSVCASNVHLETQAMSVVLKDLYEKELKVPKLFSRQLGIIQAIANKDTEVISACGMLFFTRRYILSVLGGFFTYALLFISIERQ